MLFSKRHGYIKVRDCIQFESIDEVTRNHLWSIYCNLLIDGDSAGIEIRKITEILWMDVLGHPLDTVPNSCRKYLREFHFGEEWYSVFDLLEVIYVHSYTAMLSEIEANKEREGDYNFRPFDNYQYRFSHFAKSVNNIFERECVGYRLIDGKVCPITDALEIEQIELAVNAKPSPTQTYIQHALELLADRKQTDYRNSIKESISAVESTVKIISNSENGTLPELLKRMNLHKAFQSGLSSIYGYTSDADGIRHGLKKYESSVTFADAKFFLVMCASFINYLHDKNSTAK